MISRYSVTIDGRVREVTIEDAEGKLRAFIDGRERLLDARALGEGTWSLLDGTSARLLQVDGAAPKLTVEVSHPDGEPRICAVELTETRLGDAPSEGPAVGGGPVTVRAPIPGRVVKLLVKVGDAVRAGQALLVLEAMKMENELRAPRAGAVLTVHAPEGSTVDSGQGLVVLG